MKPLTRENPVARDLNTPYVAFKQQPVIRLRGEHSRLAKLLGTDKQDHSRLWVSSQGQSYALPLRYPAYPAHSDLAHVQNVIESITTGKVALYQTLGPQQQAVFYAGDLGLKGGAPERQLLNRAQWQARMQAWAANPDNGDPEKLQIALQQITNAATNNETRLYLSNLKIKKLDAATFDQLTQLKELHLSWNQISVIPESLSKLTQLQMLDLRYNQISVIPESLSKLTQLQTLYLVGNQISVIPESLSKLTQLQKLYLFDNQISLIPESLSKLTQLQALNLGGNQISLIPESLIKLTQLQALYLHSNQISEIPESLSKLSQLKELNLYSNQISVIPESLSQLSQLQLLLLHCNPISVFDRLIVRQLKEKLGLSLSLDALPEGNPERRTGLFERIKQGAFENLEIDHAFLAATSCRLTGKAFAQITRPVVFAGQLYELAALMGYWLKTGTSPTHAEQALPLAAFFAGEQGLRKVVYQPLVQAHNQVMGGEAFTAELIDRFKQETSSLNELMCAARLFTLTQADRTTPQSIQQAQQDFKTIVLSGATRMPQTPDNLRTLQQALQHLQQSPDLQLLDEHQCVELLAHVAQMLNTAQHDQRLTALENNQQQLLTGLYALNDRLNQHHDHTRALAMRLYESIQHLSTKQEQLSVKQKDMGQALLQLRDNHAQVVDTMVDIGQRMQNIRKAKLVFTVAETAINAIPFVGPSLGALGRVLGNVAEVTKAAGFIDALQELKQLPAQVIEQNLDTTAATDLSLGQVLVICGVDADKIADHEFLTQTSVADVIGYAEIGKQQYIAQQIQAIETALLKSRAPQSTEVQSTPVQSIEAESTPAQSLQLQSSASASAQRPSGSLTAAPTPSRIDDVNISRLRIASQASVDQTSADQVSESLPATASAQAPQPKMPRIGSLDSLNGDSDALASAIKHFVPSDLRSEKLFSKALRKSIQLEQAKPLSTSLTTGVPTKEGKTATALDLAVRYQQPSLVERLIDEAEDAAEIKLASMHGIDSAKAIRLTPITGSVQQNIGMLAYFKGWFG